MDVFKNTAEKAITEEQHDAGDYRSD